MIRKIIIITFLTIVAAKCVHGSEVVRLNKGEAAPFTGALVTPEKLNDMRVVDEEHKILKKQNLALKDLQIVLEERLEYHKGLAKEYKADVNRSEFKRFWTGVAYFTLGVLLTNAAYKITLESQK